MKATGREKVYCYVDETGQDAGSLLFVVVAVVSTNDQEVLRKALTEIERQSGTGQRKWHKSRPARRLRYLKLVTENSLCRGDVFFGVYPKPIPYFFPLIEVLAHAIRAKAGSHSVARVYVDGIDRQKARELTNALRAKDLRLELVMSRRDESEPLIRLADMWAGCIRAALRGADAEGTIFDEAREARRVVAITRVPQKRKTP